MLPMHIKIDLQKGKDSKDDLLARLGLKSLRKEALPWR